MHIHILGIAGTFMTGLALLAREQGHQVSGSDKQVYPPMSTQLEAAGIALQEGYEASHLEGPTPDLVVIGNALSRGNPAVEAVLDRGLPYVSGPQWLAEQVLPGRWVLAVAGTHGKTTTSSLLAWILDQAGLKPGFLIGGVPENFGVSARLGDSPFFVIEADEYDSAFFDKRSKFVHYRPRTLVLNNLEFDHADIFPDLAAIQRQFNHLLRTVPGSGLIINNQDDKNLAETLALGCWTPVEGYSTRDNPDAAWRGKSLSADQSQFGLLTPDKKQLTAEWPLYGEHNMANALAAIAAARHVGVPPDVAMQALPGFKSVARRMQVLVQTNGITIYDDFAHHPTAIASTLAGLRARVGEARILVAFEPRSNTMRMGCHKDSLADAFKLADQVHVLDPENMQWDIQQMAGAMLGRALVSKTVSSIAESLAKELRSGDHLVIMSNGSFGNLHDQLISGIH